MLIAPLILSLTPTTPPPAELTWFEGSLDQAVAQAREKDSHVLVYFWRNGSDHCSSLYQNTLQNAEVPAALGDMVCLSANYDEKAGGKMFEIFEISTLPTMMFLAPDGKPDDAIAGYIDAKPFTEELARIHRGEGTLRGLKTAADQTEDGSEEAIEAHFKLAGKCLDLGDKHGHDAVMEEVREVHDPKARTLAGARAHLWKIQADLYGSMDKCVCESDCGEDCAATVSAVNLDLAPLYAHVKKVKQEEAKFETWNSIADFEATKQDVDRAVKAFETAFGLVPKAQAVSYPKNVAMWAVKAGEEATSSQKRLAVKFSEAALSNARKIDPASKDYMGTYGELDPSMLQAEVLCAVAFSHDLAGNRRKAKKAAEEAMSLAGSHKEDFRSYLAAVLSD